MTAATAIAAGAGPAAVFDRAAVHFSQLDNGLRIVVKEDHSAPVVAVNVVIRAGTSRETKQNNGVAHFVEHMVFRAARGGDMDRLGGAIEAIGGVVNGGTLRDCTHYSATAESGHLKVAVDALAKAILGADFESNAARAEGLVLLREAQRLADDPRVAIWELAFKLAYGDHPYALPMAGTDVSVLALERSAVDAFHRRWYVAGNASVIIVGDVKPEEATAAAAGAFTGWARGETPQPVPAVTPLKQAIEHSEPRNLPQAIVLMAFHSAGIDKPRDVCAMDLLLTVLGEGYTARLKRALVQTRIADDVKVEFLTQKLPGLFGIRATCSPERVGQVRLAIERELNRLDAELLSDDELAAAKRRLTYSYAFANETFENQAAVLGFYEAIATYEFAIAYPDEARSITPAELQAAARAHLDPKCAVWIAIMPRLQAEPPAAVAGAAGEVR